MPHVETVMRRAEKASPFLWCQRFQTFHQIFKIKQGFAHAHEDQISDNGAFGVRVFQIMAGCLHLPQDFPHAHIAGEAELSRAAKRAAHGAAHLRGKALGHASVSVLGYARNKDGFNEFSVFKPEQEFCRAVLAFADFFDSRAK